MPPIDLLDNTVTGGRHEIHLNVTMAPSFPVLMILRLLPLASIRHMAQTTFTLLSPSAALVLY